MSKKYILFGFVILSLLLNIYCSSATRIHTNTPVESELDYMIPEWDRLPFKDQRYNSTWVEL